MKRFVSLLLNYTNLSSRTMIFSMKRGPDYAIGHSAKWVLVQYYISIAFVQINAIFVSFFAILTVVHE